MFQLLLPALLSRPQAKFNADLNVSSIPVEEKVGPWRLQEDSDAALVSLFRHST